MLSVILLVFSLNSPAVAASSPNASIAKLEQSLGRLTLAVEKAPSRSAKIAMLENFHQALRLEIRKLANTQTRDDYYWRVIDMDETVTTMVDRNCGELKKILLRQDNEAFGDNAEQPSAETQQSLELAEKLCAK